MGTCQAFEWSGILKEDYTTWDEIPCLPGLSVVVAKVCGEDLALEDAKEAERGRWEKRMAEFESAYGPVILTHFDFPMKLYGENSSCDHNWKQYVGLTQRYEYCTKCDEKKL